MKKYLILALITFVALFIIAYNSAESTPISEENIDVPETVIKSGNSDLTQTIAEALIVKITNEAEYSGESSPGEIDSENYFGTINPPWDGIVEFTIFLRRNNDPIIAVSKKACGPICKQELNFFTYKNEVWTDVSNEIFPFVSNTQLTDDETELYKLLKERGEEESIAFLYVLPQAGTAIELVDQYDVFRNEENVFGPLYKFEWNWTNGRFSRQKLF